MKYSFVIILDDEKKLKNKLNNIPSSFNKEIIMVGTKKYLDKYKDKYPFIVYENKNYADALNESLNIITGDYVNFSFASSYIEKGGLEKLENSIKSNKIERVYQFNSFKNFIINKQKLHNPIDEEEVSTTKNFNSISLNIDAYFFSTSLVYKFNNELNEFTLSDFVIRTLNYTRIYYRFNNDYCYINRIPVTDFKTSLASHEDWYNKFIEEYVLKMLKEYDNYYIKMNCYYLIMIRYCANAGSNNKKAINDEQLDKFFNLVDECLNYIPEDIILSLNEENIPVIYNDIFRKIKNDKYIDKLDKTGFKICEAGNVGIVIDAINVNKDNLVIDAEYSELDYIEHGINIIAKLDEKELQLKRNYVYSKTTFFDRTFKDKYTFSFEVLKKDISDKSSLRFYVTDGRETIITKVLFSEIRPQSRLTNMFTHSYFKYDKKRIITKTPNELIFKKVSSFDLVKQEFNLYKDFLNESIKKKLGYQSLFLRILFRLTRVFYKNKRIWVTFDKLYKGGDNGEYFYQYCLKNKDKIRCYYVINSTAHDYQRLKHQKYVLRFKSIKEYLVVLNSQAVFATHSNPYNFLAFTRGKEKYFRDLMNFDVFCLQHGLTIQDIAHLQNRVCDNTKLYFCASLNEITNLEQAKYDYKGYDYLKKTGIPRFDGLKSKEKKEILITPTWRSNMANTNTVIGGTRPYFEEFKNTEYFKIFNTLINDERLIKCAKEYGYMITYLIHPTLTSQINDFDRNDYVNIYSVTEDQSYEKILTESSLMVTDYSGVQYDFAYMRKPLIYFHPDELPPHYGAGGINYETEGFGPIIKDIDSLVDALIMNMKNNCVNSEEYIKRADKFFIYNDFNSCKRIYDETIKYYKER